MPEQNFAEIIRLRRVALRKSQEELGKVLGITKQSYGALENGKSEFKVSQLKAVCEYLGLNFEELNSQLPQPSKPAMITADQYIKLTDRLIEQQQRTEALMAKIQVVQQMFDETKAQLKSTREKLAEESVMAFLLESIAKKHSANGNVKSVRWNEIAKALNLPNADRFMEDYKMWLDENTGEETAASIIDDAIATASTPVTPVDVNNKRSSKS